MSRILLASATVLLFALVFAAPLPAQSPAKAESFADQVAALKLKSEEALEAKKWVRFYSANMKLNQLLPYDPQYAINVVKACAMLDRASTAYHYMLQLQQQGITYDFNSDEETESIRDTQAYEHINNLLLDAANPSGEGSVVFTLSGNAADYGAVAWDESRDRFLFGTSGERALLAVTDSGESEVLLKADETNGIESITGLAVDADDNRLWLASAGEGTGKLFELDLKTMDVLGKYSFPKDGLEHHPGSLAITDDNDVYVLDRANSIIYFKSPQDGTLKAFFASPEMLAPGDIDVMPDNSKIFVSDANKGILVIDLIQQKAVKLGGPETMNLGGIMSITLSEDKLYVIQGAFKPPRIIMLDLDSSGIAAESLTPMANALFEFNRPGFGMIRGDDLYYVANTASTDGSGAIVMRTPLTADAGTVAPRMPGQSTGMPAKATKE